MLVVAACILLFHPAIKPRVPYLADLKVKIPYLHKIEIPGLEIPLNSFFARVSVQRGTLLIKGQHDPDWKLLEDRPDELQSYDSLFTQINSQATVSLGIGTDIRVSPGTAITFEQFRDKTYVDLTKGHTIFRVRDPKQSHKLGIKLDGHEIFLHTKQANFHLEVSGLQGQRILKSHKGGGTLYLKDKKFNVQPGDSFTIGEANLERLEEKTVKLIYPTTNAVLTEKDQVKVKFNWQDYQNVVHYQLLVARSIEFKRVIFPKSTPASTNRTQFKRSGIYYWKVIAKTSTGKEIHSLPQVFEIRLTEEEKKTELQQFTPPQLKVLPRGQLVINKPNYLGSGNLSKVEDYADKEVKSATPPDNIVPPHMKGKKVPKAKLISPKNKKSYGVPFVPIIVNFRWNGDAMKYILEVGRDPFFKDVMAKKETDDLKVELQLHALGKFFWRVTSINGGKEELSATSSFFLRPKAPKMIAPVCSTKMNTKDKVVFRWTPSSFQQQHYFQFQIADDYEFKNLLANKKRNQNGHVWKPKANLFFSRVRQIVGKTAGHWSKVCKLELEY